MLQSFLCHSFAIRPLSRPLTPPRPAGIVWRRRQPKNRRRAAEPAEIIGLRCRRIFLRRAAACSDYRHSCQVNNLS